MDYEPWWEEKDLGAPPPDEIAQERAARKAKRDFDDWWARGAPESEVTYPVAGFLVAPGGVTMAASSLKHFQKRPLLPYGDTVRIQLPRRSP